MVEGRLFNQDLDHGLHNADVDILSPLHSIPKEEGFFDSIICNAVLEHVENPEDVMKEFRRVCKPGGFLYLSVPFMQPEHLDPTDFQRYTLEGLKCLIQKHSFHVIKAGGLHSVYATLGWVFIEWLKSASAVEAYLIRHVLLPYVHYRHRRSGLHVHAVASAYYVLGCRHTGQMPGYPYTKHSETDR